MNVPASYFMCGEKNSEDIFQGVFFHVNHLIAGK